MLPKDFSLYATVHSFYRRCSIKGIKNAECVTASHTQSGRSKNPSYTIIALQNVKTTSASEKIDGEKTLKDEKGISLYERAYTHHDLLFKGQRQD
jgi:hypothetical protein